MWFQSFGKSSSTWLWYCKKIMLCNFNTKLTYSLIPHISYWHKDEIEKSWLLSKCFLLQKIRQHFEKLKIVWKYYWMDKIYRNRQDWQVNLKYHSIFSFIPNKTKNISHQELLLLFLVCISIFIWHWNYFIHWKILYSKHQYGNMIYCS